MELNRQQRLCQDVLLAVSAFVVGVCAALVVVESAAEGSMAIDNPPSADYADCADGGQTRSSEFAIRHSSFPRLMTWIEVTEVNPEAQWPSIEAGLRSWGASGTIEGVVGLVSPEHVALFHDFMNLCDEIGLDFVPAIEATTTAMGRVTGSDGKIYRDLASREGWERVADAMSVAVSITGSSLVGLDIDRAAKGYVLGFVELDLAGLARGIRQLPHGVDVLLYPTIESSNLIRARRQLELTRVFLAELPEVYLVDATMGSRGRYGEVVAGLNHDNLVELNDEFYGPGRPLFHLFWAYGNDRFWRDDELIGLLWGTVHDPDVGIIYPGAARFAEAAESLGAIFQRARDGRP